MVIMVLVVSDDPNEDGADDEQGDDDNGNNGGGDGWMMINSTYVDYNWIHHTQHHRHRCFSSDQVHSSHDYYSQDKQQLVHNL